MLRNFSTYLIALFILLGAASSSALEVVGSDSRVRTLIYGKNDVYRVTTTFGYQTTIQFEEEEKIKTISLGNSGFFKITPQRNRIFVKAIVPNVLTNMTVITDRRNYEIELSSIMQSLSEIIYLVRFYYPDTEEQNIGNMPAMMAPQNVNTTVPDVALPQGYVPGMNMGMQMPTTAGFSGMGAAPGMQPQMMAAQPMMSTNYNQMTVPGVSPVMGNNYNYNYTLTGPEAISPSEVFDDGSKTYLRFNQSMQPTFRVISPGGGEIPTGYNIMNGYYVIDTVSPQINVYFGSEMVSVFNENMGGR